MKGLPDWARRARSGWRWTGSERPPFAEDPGEGQESVWDYPRPPRVEPDHRRVVVKAGGATLADTTAAVRILETASPPTFYLSPEDVAAELLTEADGRSRCEWKGEAVYWSARPPGGPVVERAGWSYPDPFSDYAGIRNHLSFFPARVACFVDGERVRPQPGGFYGGWVTDEIVGPFKGEGSDAGL